MGLAETVQKAAQSAFKAVGNIPEVCTYTSKGAQVYVNGQYTSTDTEYTGLKFLFTDYESREVDGTVILSTDMKMSIPRLNLTPTPKKQDYLTDADGVVWQVGQIWML